MLVTFALKYVFVGLSVGRMTGKDSFFVENWKDMKLKLCQAQTSPEGAWLEVAAYIGQLQGESQVLETGRKVLKKEK